MMLFDINTSEVLSKLAALNPGRGAHVTPRTPARTVSAGCAARSGVWSLAMEDGMYSFSSLLAFYLIIEKFTKN
jgi:hypothetical protein